MNLLDPITLIFYGIGGVCLLGTYLLLNSVYKDDRRRYTRLNLKFKQLVADPKSTAVGSFLFDEKTEKELKRLLVPTWIDSVVFNGMRLAVLVVASVLLLIKTRMGIGPFSPTFLSVVCLFFSVGCILRKGLPLYYFLNLNRKYRVRRKNNEVYSLYLLIASEFSTHDERVGNIYNLLYESRKYFHHIKKAIDKALSNGHGKEINWDAFVRDIHTPEAEKLALVMQEVEVLPVSQTHELLKQKREEFSNLNVMEYEDYLEDRGKIIHLVAFTVCAISLFICPIVVHFLQYKDMINMSNNL
ncbi:hypothetical protein IHV12_19690 [Fictibacillus sp. 7GRE50]|uniref:hypothetical protein n=1 Tax=Fictibacillus sp. 7GRE50 TaxID=2745878 RepID=UPI0018CF117D|nr:hypothetical protein [Fictibacillus sp. 7GRE50]MBH0167151.1 hypothetical protein [Fictibacillus sp. 7GRE50]